MILVLRDSRLSFFCYALVRQVISLSHSATLIQKAQFKAERFFIPRTTPYVESEKTNVVLADSFVYKPPAWKHRALWPDHHHDHELNWLELNSHLFGSERCNLFFFVKWKLKIRLMNINVALAMNIIQSIIEFSNVLHDILNYKNVGLHLKAQLLQIYERIKCL